MRCNVLPLCVQASPGEATAMPRIEKVRGCAPAISSGEGPLPGDMGGVCIGVWPGVPSGDTSGDRAGSRSFASPLAAAAGESGSLASKPCGRKARNHLTAPDAARTLPAPAAASC